MGVRCARDTERYMEDLPYTINQDGTTLGSAITIKDDRNDDIQIHRNTVRDILHIVSKNHERLDPAFVIYNTAGAVVKQGNFCNSSINVANLHAGIYILTVDNPKKTFKIIKK